MGFERMRDGYRNSLAFCLEHAWMFILLFLLFCAASLPIALVLGRDFFPSVDAGSDPPAHARPRRTARRGNGAGIRRGG